MAGPSRPVSGRPQSGRSIHSGDSFLAPAQVIEFDPLPHRTNCSPSRLHKVLRTNHQAAAFSPSATPKYLNDFSKALASEVRILLQEVGKLRDERRALQQIRPSESPRPKASDTLSSEIAELMAVKAKHSAGGEYSPDCAPRAMPPAPGLLRPRPQKPLALDGPARPAWRTRHQASRAPAQGGRAIRRSRPDPTSTSAPRHRGAAPGTALVGTVRPNPNVHPVVRGPEPSQAVVQAPPPRQGLFGPVDATTFLEAPSRRIAYYNVFKL
ncbi:hypothetical protein EDB84DRAFT_1562662 [Lactarius hengduanensis]|nr:hypothetical protein EDB84DRAFT_1562662 [Lactarius hengduanensis]